jgi:hypothetical protein
MAAGGTEECGNCHVDKITTYRDTFHGQVTALGFTRMATRSDRHGSHDAPPASNPASQVAGQTPAAVRTCHQGANENCHTIRTPTSMTGAQPGSLVACSCRCRWPASSCSSARTR